MIRLCEKKRIRKSACQNFNLIDYDSIRLTPYNEKSNGLTYYIIADDNKLGGI